VNNPIRLSPYCKKDTPQIVAELMSVKGDAMNPADKQLSNPLVYLLIPLKTI